MLTRVIDLLPGDLGKLLRYAAVSAISVPLTQSVFWVLLQTDLHEVVAYLLAIAISTGPNYLLNRNWVWKKQGSNSLRGEVAPYWVLTFVGTGLSALCVWIAGRITDRDLILMAASLVGFGVVWIFKFFILEHLLFNDEQATQASDDASPSDRGVSDSTR